MSASTGGKSSAPARLSSPMLTVELVSLALELRAESGLRKLILLFWLDSDVLESDFFSLPSRELLRNRPFFLFLTAPGSTWSVRAKPPRDGPSWVGVATGVSSPEALVVVMIGTSCCRTVPLLCSLRREVKEVRRGERTTAAMP